MANPGSRPSGQYVTYQGRNVQLQQGYGLSTGPRPGYVQVQFRGQRMFAHPRDFYSSARSAVLSQLKGPGQKL